MNIWKSRSTISKGNRQNL